jgi:hypothetical protein
MGFDGSEFLVAVGDLLGGPVLGQPRPGSIDLPLGCGVATRQGEDAVALRQGDVGRDRRPHLLERRLVREAAAELELDLGRIAVHPFAGTPESCLVVCHGVLLITGTGVGHM